jgi:hypothetical protein
VAHVSFLKYIQNGNIAGAAWDALQLLLLAPPASHMPPTTYCHF